MRNRGPTGHARDRRSVVRIEIDICMHVGGTQVIELRCKLQSYLDIERPGCRQAAVLARHNLPLAAGMIRICGADHVLIRVCLKLDMPR